VAGRLPEKAALEKRALAFKPNFIILMEFFARESIVKGSSRTSLRKVFFILAGSI
jgi:hypothetical protein